MVRQWSDNGWAIVWLDSVQKINRKWLDSGLFRIWTDNGLLDNGKKSLLRSWTDNVMVRQCSDNGWTMVWSDCNLGIEWSLNGETIVRQLGQVV